MITDVDPLQYGLLFERFLNPARISMPDFDIDFEDSLREKVIQYVTHQYGSDNVCAIGTYMKLARKAAFKDVARAMGMSFERANHLTTLLPETISIDEAVMSSDDEYADFRSVYNHDPLFAQTLAYSQRLEGNLRQLGVHACGYIIAPDPIVNYTALFDG
jgi:DNA polymerase-3 subunit alpha